MDVGVLEQKLRALPGVLDCSVSAEGVAVVVHPEVDPRLIELHAQVLLGEAGDRRPLLVVGGMTVGPRVLPSGRPSTNRRPRRSGPSPLSLVGFAALVLAVLAVVPIAGRESPSRGAGSATGSTAPAGVGRLPVVDGGSGPDEGTVEVALDAPPAAPLPVELVAAAAEPVPASGVRLASVTPPPAVAAPEAVALAPAPAAADPVVAKGKDKGKGNGKGHGRAGEVRATGHAGSVHVAMAVPGKADPPGRRRGHER